MSIFHRMMISSGIYFPLGVHLEKAQNKYGEAFKQLSTGNHSLVMLATKLKDLGLKTKKHLSKRMVQNAIVNELLSSSNE